MQDRSARGRRQSARRPAHGGVKLARSPFERRCALPIGHHRHHGLLLQKTFRSRPLTVRPRHGFQLRHRRAAQRRQVDPVQRDPRYRGGRGRELSVLHDRTQHWRVPVPDRRLDRVAKSRARQEVVPTQLEVVDIAGLVRGASRGEGLGNRFLGAIREVDAILHVLRCFEGGDVAHVEGAVDPMRDLELVETELLLADLAALERRSKG